ncbi:hypothetical protein U2H75_003025 [Escherichia coli]|nr:hypothetical protein [Escherichia coli]HBQ4879987.1 hypothetical protein [Escherichia coli]
MGLKFDAHQLKRAGSRLDNRQKAFKRYLIQDMGKQARFVERLGRAMAPLETGALETAIFARVVKEGYSGLRIELSVSGAKPRQGHPGVEVGDYAKYMEFDEYRLGYLSRMKSVTNPPISGIKPRVGPHFLERSAEISERRFSESILEAARKSGFKRG